jgi:hypothetical protein
MQFNFVNLVCCCVCSYLQPTLLLLLTLHVSSFCLCSGLHGPQHTYEGLLHECALHV